MFNVRTETSRANHNFFVFEFAKCTRKFEKLKSIFKRKRFVVLVFANSGEHRLFFFLGSTYLDHRTIATDFYKNLSACVRVCSKFAFSHFLAAVVVFGTFHFGFEVVVKVFH